MKHCHHCGTVLPEAAKFCHNCGKPQESQTQEEPTIFDQEDSAEKEFIDLFFQMLRKRIEEEFLSDKFQAYSEMVYESGFRDTLYRRAAQYAEEQDAPGPTLNDLLDFFIIHFCKKLNQVYFPEAILSYQNVEEDQIDLFKMTLDYLDFANESETYYTDFLAMPLEQLRNAGKFFLFPDKEERILLICDQSFFGSCKEGFALTEKAIYWKAYLQTARKVAFKDLTEIKREKDWITINGHFFNVNLGLNLKLQMLLRKLKLMNDS